MQCSVEYDAQLARLGILSEGRVAVEFEAQQLSVAELITTAVRTQMLMRRLRAESQGDDSPPPHLSEQDIENGLRCGRIALKKPRITTPLNWSVEEQHELEHALKSFRDGGFQVLLDGHLHRDPDQIVEIAEHSAIIFLRLIPLAGG